MLWLRAWGENLGFEGSGSGFEPQSNNVGASLGPSYILHTYIDFSWDRGGKKGINKRCEALDLNPNP